MSDCETGRKKNVPLRDALNGAIGYINCELTLVEMDLEYPQRFLEFPPDITPLARWAGNINDLIEYSIAPQVSGRLLKPSGERMTYADVIKLIELIFGIIVSGAYDRKTKIFGRQNNTKFQDEMREVFLEEAKKSVK